MIPLAEYTISRALRQNRVIHPRVMAIAHTILQVAAFPPRLKATAASSATTP